MKILIPLGKLVTLSGNQVIVPNTGLSLEIYEYDETNPPLYTKGSVIASTGNGKITEVSGTGNYIAEVDYSFTATVLSNGSPIQGWIGVLFIGDTYPELP